MLQNFHEGQPFSVTVGFDSMIKLMKTHDGKGTEGLGGSELG